MTAHPARLMATASGLTTMGALTPFLLGAQAVAVRGDAAEVGVEIVLEAGAEEINDYGESWQIVSEATDFVAVRTALQEADVDYDSAEAVFLPSIEVPLDLEGAKKMIRVVDALEDSDDVQNVYTNGDVPDDVLAELDAEG